MSIFQRQRDRQAFTLVELMVAMTITLLLMAGLARSFGVIGKSIQEGRSQVTLSSKTRHLSFALREDLGNRTVDAKPPVSSTGGAGYFMYYEGPLTEHTFGIYGAAPERTTSDGERLIPDPTVDTDMDSVPDFFDSKPFESTPARVNVTNDGPTYRRHGRIGDFDDYIAFTAEASGDQWFTGKVPAYLVDDNPLGLASYDPMEPTVIRSKYAEIIIWASPATQVDPSDNSLILANNPTAMPAYNDDDRNLVPDRIVLHQRILLIRPDLNRRLSKAAVNLDDTMFLRPMGAATTDPDAVPIPLQRIYPINNPSAVAGLLPVSGTPTGNQQMMRNDWLVGMAPLHHFFDLSLRRIIHPDTGAPTNYVAANSLADLVQPHNRFAHVRYPGGFFDGSMNNNGTSMPLLALGWNDTLLNWQGTADLRAEPPTGTAPSWFPASHPSSRTLTTPGGSAQNQRSGIFNGWLLPHFELGDPNLAFNPDETPDQWKRGYLATLDQRWDRTGEDVIAANILAFDIRGYDPTAPVFVTSGADGQPGRAGVNDDGVSGTDFTGEISIAGAYESRTELGAFGSDDELINVTDLGIYALMGESIMNPANESTFHPPPPPLSPFHFQAIANRGAFVDLLYPYLDGTPLIDRTQEALSAISPVDFNYNAFMRSALSLYPIPNTTLNSLKRSGKLVQRNNSADIVFFQPTYDTWTDGYEHDGFDQSPSRQGDVSPVDKLGTVWVLNTPAGTSTPELIPDAAKQNRQIDSAQYDASQPETSPPIAIDLSAISITVRMLDPSTEEMTQFTVVEGLQ